jgi:hypothetical protein
MITDRILVEARRSAIDFPFLELGLGEAGESVADSFSAKIRNLVTTELRISELTFRDVEVETATDSVALLASTGTSFSLPLKVIKRLPIDGGFSSAQIGGGFHSNIQKNVIV